MSLRRSKARLRGLAQGPDARVLAAVYLFAVEVVVARLCLEWESEGARGGLALGVCIVGLAYVVHGIDTLACVDARGAADRRSKPAAYHNLRSDELSSR